MLRVNERQPGEPVEDAVVLREDDGEERFLQRIGFALEHAEGVVAAIRIMRREGDETAFGQSRGEGLVVGIAAALRIVVNRIHRHAFQSVLANHDRSALARLEIFRHEQHAPGKDGWPDIERDVVGSPTPHPVPLPIGWGEGGRRPGEGAIRGSTARFEFDAAGAGIDRLVGFREAADDFVPKVVFERFCGRDPILSRTRSCFAPKKVVARSLGKLEQSLGVIDQFLHLAALAFAGIEIFSQLQRRGRGGGL